LMGYKGFRQDCRYMHTSGALRWMLRIHRRRANSHIHKSVGDPP
jgi:hypothetical protein